MLRVRLQIMKCVIVVEWFKPESPLLFLLLVPEFVSVFSLVYYTVKAL